jgi:hypothetical protein
MITRREFCAAVGAGAMSACLPQTAIAWSDPSPFRATPNPHNGHFTIEDARRCLDRWSADDPVYTQCLELTHYKTASIDALNLLAEREWIFANFGLAALTENVAHALGQLSGCVEFHHVEQASANAIAYLASLSEELIFTNVESLSERGIANLRESLNPLTTSRGISIGGSFLLDRPAARALASLPMDIDLYPIRKEQALNAGAWSELSDAPDKHVEIQVWPSPLSYIITLHHGEHKDAVIKTWTWDAESQTLIDKRISVELASSLLQGMALYDFAS